MVTVCPNCGSTEVDVNPEVDMLQWVDFKNEWYCFKCKYVGAMPDVDKNELEEFRKEIKANSERRLDKLKQ